MTMLRWMMALALMLFAVPAQAQAPRLTPEAGRQAYRYTVVQRNPGYPDAGYQLDFDLLSDGKGGLVAIVIGAFDTDTGRPVPAAIKDSCRTQLHAQPGELARVVLAPAIPERLDEKFIAMCAPAELFYPMTDVAKIGWLQMHPALAGLKRAGDSVRLPGFSWWHDRLGSETRESSPDSRVNFVALTPDRATIEWLPKPMAVTVVTHGGNQGRDVTLTGVEDFGYRVEIDPRTGMLLGAVSTHDDNRLKINLPDGRTAPVNITREVIIAPRKDN
jgi:hypothetical protein